MNQFAKSISIALTNSNLNLNSDHSAGSALSHTFYDFWFFHFYMSVPSGAIDLDENIDMLPSYDVERDIESGIKLDNKTETEQLSRSDPPIMEPAPTTGSGSRTGTPIDASVYDKMTVRAAYFSADEISVSRETLLNLLRALSYSYKSAESLRLLTGLVVEGFHLQGIRQLKPGSSKAISPEMLKAVYADIGEMSACRPQALVAELTTSRREGKLLDMLYEHTVTSYLELLQQISCFKNASNDILLTFSKATDMSAEAPIDDIVDEIIKLKGLPDYTDGKFILPTSAAVSALDIVRRSDHITDAQHENEMLRATIDSLRKELSESANATILMRKETASGTVETEKLKAELDKLREQNKRLKHIADDAKAETAATRTSNAALRQQLETLKTNNANGPVNPSKLDQNTTKSRSRSVRDNTDLLTTADLNHTGTGYTGPPSHAAARQHRQSRPTSAAQQRIFSGKVAPARVEINNSSYYAIHGQNEEVNNTGVPTTTVRVVKRNVAVTDNCLVCIGPRNPSPSTKAKSPEKYLQDMKATSPDVRRLASIPGNTRIGKNNQLCSSYYDSQRAVTPNRKPNQSIGPVSKATPKRPNSSRPQPSASRTPITKTPSRDQHHSQMTQNKGGMKMYASIMPSDTASKTPRSKTPVDDLYNQIDRLSVELAAEKEKRHALLDENRNLKSTLTTMERQTRQQMNNIESKYRAILEHTIKKLTNRA